MRICPCGGACRLEEIVEQGRDEMAQFARRFVGERGSKGDRMLIERELQNLGYEPANAQVAPQEQVEPAQGIPLLDHQDMDIRAQDELGHPVAPVDQANPQSSLNLMDIEELEPAMQSPRRKIPRLGDTEAENPMYVCKICHDMNGSAFVRCCACCQLLHKSCVGVAGENLVCSDCTSIFQRSGGGIINQAHVTAIFKLHAVAREAMRREAEKILEGAALTRHTLEYLAQELRSPLLELAVTTIPSPAPPQVAINVPRDPGLIQWDIQQQPAHLGTRGGQAASAELPLPELCAVCKLTLAIEVKCQQCGDLYCVNCANVKFNLDDEKFLCQHCIRNVLGIEFGDHATLKDSESESENEYEAMDVDVDVNVGASTSSAAAPSANKDPTELLPVPPSADNNELCVVCHRRFDLHCSMCVRPFCIDCTGDDFNLDDEPFSCYRCIGGTQPFYDDSDDEDSESEASNDNEDRNDLDYNPSRSKAALTTPSTSSATPPHSATGLSGFSSLVDPLWRPPGELCFYYYLRNIHWKLHDNFLKRTRNSMIQFLMKQTYQHLSYLFLSGKFILLSTTSCCHHQRIPCP